MSRVIEFRSYSLKPGSRDEFHRLSSEYSIPLLHRWKIDVVAFGPSLDEENAYYLLRSFASVEELRQAENAFYGSDDWRKGPREAILALIDAYTSAVIEVDDATLAGLRKVPAPASD